MMRMKAAVMALAMMASPALAQDAPPAPELEFAFEIIANIDPTVVQGDTAFGGRQFIPITGGTVTGEGISGEVMDGGWDYQLIRADGCMDVVADYFLKMSDGTIVNVNNTAVLCRNEDGSVPPVFTRPIFEAPLGEWEWLGQHIFVGTLGAVPGSEGKAVKIRVYAVK